jgi:colicin import membrane protein
MSESVRDRWLSIGMSVVLHGSLIALLALGWWHFRRPAPAPTLSIDATVVDARTLKGVGTASIQAPKPKQAQPAQSAPPPPVAQPEGPPPPSPDEVAMREQAAKEEAQHQAEAEQQLLARQQAKQAREEAQRQAAAEAAQQAAQAKAAAEAKQAAEAAAQAKKLAAEKQLAEARQKAEAKKLAEEKKLAEQQAAEERAARVADLQQSLQEDERASASSGALASWQAEITARIQQHWIRPPTAQPGIDCVLNVTQVPGGSVTDVSVGQCNGDEAVRESIEAAVYRASPLPPPPDPSLFERQLVIEFKPTN